MLVKKESPLTHIKAVVASISKEALHILLKLPKHFQWESGGLIIFQPLEELQKMQVERNFPIAADAYSSSVNDVPTSLRKGRKRDHVSF